MAQSKSKSESPESESEERLMQWLRDAHAMEKQAEQMLSALESRIESYPKIRSKIKAHLRETKDQAKRLERCIERRGGSTSTVKDMTGKIVAMAQGISGLFAGDEIMKGALASYTFEHMEIGSYKILIAAAEEAGDKETARECRGILREEEAMAEWLSNNLGSLTADYLEREDAESDRAKR